MLKICLKNLKIIKQLNMFHSNKNLNQLWNNFETKIEILKIYYD